MDKLIPTSGVHITKAEFPAGFFVARYDSGGLCSDPRWFDTLAKAEKYAQALTTS